jgi:beta-lactamase class C
LEKIVSGNSAEMALNAIPATAIDPPMPLRSDAILNKTGSTNGFGTYVVFVPGKKIGIVILANKNYPNDARVKATYQVLSHLTE